MTRSAMAFEVCPLFNLRPKTPAPVFCGQRASGPEKECTAPHRDDERENEAAGDKPSLEGRRILVVEDEFLLALEVEAALESFGCFVAGPFAKLEKAMVAARATRLDTWTPWGHFTVHSMQSPQRTVACSGDISRYLSRPSANWP